jgi:hypothetical protein
MTTTVRFTITHAPTVGVSVVTIVFSKLSHAMHVDHSVIIATLRMTIQPKLVRSAMKHFAALVGVNLEVKELNVATGSIVISIIGAMAVERIEFFKVVKVAAMKHVAATMLHLPSKNDS